jgi:iron-sulfur cluster repair protein YtfE (RIC family)
MSEKIEGARDIGPGMTVNEIIAEHPHTVAVFKRMGIDACCGGALPIAEVARKHRLNFLELIAELEGP